MVILDAIFFTVLQTVSNGETSSSQSSSIAPRDKHKIGQESNRVACGTLAKSYLNSFPAAIRNLYIQP